jgi:sorbitol-specific phosphotransferase system component IIC
MPFPTDPESILALVFSIVVPYILSLPFLKNLGSKDKAIFQVVLAVIVYGGAAKWIFPEVELSEIFQWAMIASGMGTANYAVVTSAKRKFWDGRKK